MAELRFYDVDQTTFGCPVASPTALKRMKAHATRQDFADPLRRVVRKSVLCVKAADVAAVMGECGWLVRERRDFYKVEIDSSEQIFYIVYPEQENGGGTKWERL